MPTIISRSSPVQVGSLTTWAEVSAGKYASLARKTDGTIWTWGYNGPGGWLGIGTTAHESSPVQIGSATNWTKTVLEHATGHAINSDGKLYSWGRGNYATVGDGTVLNRNTPVQVGSLTTWGSLLFKGGTDTMAAITTGKTLFIWGTNADGELGQGDVISRSSPVQLGSDSDWDYVACGKRHVLAIKGDQA